jgi:hypothetical protein
MTHRQAVGHGDEQTDAHRCDEVDAGNIDDGAFVCRHDGGNEAGFTTVDTRSVEAPGKGDLRQPVIKI